MVVEAPNEGVRLISPQRVVLANYKTGVQANRKGAANKNREASFIGSRCHVSTEPPRGGNRIDATGTGSRASPSRWSPTANPNRQRTRGISRRAGEILSSVAVLRRCRPDLKSGGKHKRARGEILGLFLCLVRNIF